MEVKLMNSLLLKKDPIVTEVTKQIKRIFEPMAKYPSIPLGLTEETHDSLMIYRFSERLSHVLAYMIPNNSIRLPVTFLNEKGKEVTYNGKAYRTSSNVVATFLYNKDEKKVIVLFKGTSKDNFIRDLDTSGGAGNESYRNSKKELFCLLNEYIELLDEKAKDLKLVIGGHSLGGADAQNFSADILNSIASDDGSIIKEKINEILILPCNPAGISFESRTKAQQAIKKINGNVDVTFAPILVHNDPVQQTGQAYLFTGYENKKYVNIQVMKKENEISGPLKYLKAHTDTNFVKDKNLLENIYPKSSTYKIYSNGTSGAQDNLNTKLGSIEENAATKYIMEKAKIILQQYQRKNNCEFFPFNPSFFAESFPRKKAPLIEYEDIIPESEHFEIKVSNPIGAIKADI